MNFVPYPGKVEVNPINRDTVILSDSEKYEELATIIQVGEGVTWFKPGDVVFFLAYGMEQTPEYEGKTHYVLPANDKIIIGKCTTNEASVKTDTFTTLESLDSSITESKNFVPDVNFGNSSTNEPPTAST